jgi:hypothetical protein
VGRPVRAEYWKRSHLQGSLPERIQRFNAQAWNSGPLLPLITSKKVALLSVAVVAATSAPAFGQGAGGGVDA